MIPGLFRQSAIEHRSNKLYGEVVLASPIGHIAIFFLLLVLAALIFTFALVGEYRSTERIEGILTPRSRTICITAKKSGVLKSVFVKLGDTVAKGDALISILEVDENRVSMEKVPTILRLGDEYAANQEFLFYTIIASGSGEVTFVEENTNQTVNTHDVLVEIDSDEHVLEAKFAIPTRVARFVQTGQTIRFSYLEFPHQEFGYQVGTISQISRTERDLPIEFPSTEAQGHYNVLTVEFENQYFEGKRRRHPIQTGMAVRAELVLEKKHIWELILKPFQGVGS